MLQSGSYDLAAKGYFTRCSAARLARALGSCYASRQRRVLILQSLSMNEIGFGRNDLCPCGSGKKYKNCHMPGAETTVSRAKSRANSPRSRVDAALRSALVHHRAGRLADAANIYWQILQEFPEEFDAMHLLGMAAHDGGDDLAAEELIAKAIGIAPDKAEMHSNLGMVQLA